MAMAVAMLPNSAARVELSSLDSDLTNGRAVGATRGDAVLDRRRAAQRAREPQPAHDQYDHENQRCDELAARATFIAVFQRRHSYPLLADVNVDTAREFDAINHACEVPASACR